MALKTFNVDEIAYKEFSEYCKRNGISMSKKVGNFIKEEMELIKGKGEEVLKKVEEECKKHPLSKYC